MRPTTIPLRLAGLLALLAIAALATSPAASATKAKRGEAASAASCTRPYRASSPWNTPVPAGVAVDPRSAAKVATMSPATRKLTSDPTQFTFPVYYARAGTPRVPVTYVDGWHSRVSGNGTKLVNTRSIDPSQRVTTMPVPPNAVAAAGYDAQIVVIDEATGEEWDASQFSKDASGYHAWNIGRTSPTTGGRPKIMPEYEGTAHWNGAIVAGTPSAIPLSAFRVVAPPAR